MTHPIQRARRWARRTCWMARAVAADLGLGAGRPPVWRRDNPFWHKAIRADARRGRLAGRLLLTTLTLAALLVGGLGLHEIYPRFVRFFLRFSALSWPFWLFITISFAHTLLILGTRAAFATSLGLEAQRETLPGLLLTPLRRAEIPWAMAIPPAVATGLVALSGLPVYLLLREFGGCDWGDLVWLFFVFALLAFDPPAYARPALGADPAPLIATRAARRGRTGGGAVSSVPLFAFLAWTLGNWVRGMGGWGFHLLAILPATVQNLLLVFFAWPYCAALVLASPLPFFGVRLPPLVYIVPLIAVGWIISALRTGAALAAGDLVEMRRLPLNRRAETLARGTARLGLFCFVGVIWQPWVLSGDTGRLLGAAVPGLASNLAGLLLALGAGAIARAVQAAAAAVTVRSATKTLRPPRPLLHKVLGRTARPLRLALLLFALACLCGGVSPFVPAVFATLGRLALVALACVTGAVGYGGYFNRLAALSAGGKFAGSRTFFLSGLRTILPLAVPFLALAVPHLSPLAALSPLTAWLELFPGSDTTIHAFPYVPLGPLPPFGLCVAAPVALGAFLLIHASRSPRPLPSPPVRRAVAGADSKVGGRFPHHAERTAALMAWVTAHTDNPLFTYEMRTRTRDGRWYDNLIIAGVLLPLVVGLAARYPDVIGLFSFFAVLGFFHGGSPLGLLPPTAMQAYADLAALLLSIEFYVLALRGQVIGEALFWKDQERGTLGGLLLTPLTSGQLFWGKVWGQSSGYVASWAICGAVGLLLYGLASPLIGLGPALGAWAMSQAFIAAAFILGMGLGTALAAHTLRFRVLRGLSTLLLIFAYGAGFRLFIWPDLFAMPLNPAILLTHRLAFGTLYALVLAVLAFAYAHWRVVVLRHRDMAFGEGAAG